jgi:phosphoserine phosphatase
MKEPKPLCVDLDGTLIAEDVTLVAADIFMRRGLGNLLRMFLWLLHGRAYLKRKLAEAVNLDVDSLSYNDRVLDLISRRKKKGCKIFLATACDAIYANMIADYLGVFDGVFASDGSANLRATAKASVLALAFGEKGFSYAGNSRDDVPVWDKSSECILVSPSKKALKKMQGRKYLLFE